MKLRGIISVLILCFTMGTVHAATLTGTLKGGKKLRKSKAVVYIKGATQAKVTPLNRITLDQKNMEFTPHVLPITVGTTVTFLNSDEVRHNVYSPDKETYNLGSWPKGDVKTYQYTKKGVYTQLCNVHPEMESFIVVLDTPYFALSDKKGRFEIKNLPPGNYTVRVWHEKLRFKKQKITVKTKALNLTIPRRK